MTWEMSSTSTNICVVVPTKEQFLGDKRNICCNKDGCNKSFIHDGALRMHLVKSHGEIKSDSDRRLFHKVKAKDEDVIFHFHCPYDICQYNVGSKRHFSTFSLLKQHYMKIHAERKFLCNKCKMTFSLERELRRHTSRCGVLYQCGNCPVQYTTREMLLKHCTEQRHMFPEVFQKQLDQIAEKRKAKKNQNNQSAVLVTTIPVMLIQVATTPTQSSIPKLNQPITPNQQTLLKSIQPKPSTLKPFTISEGLQINGNKNVGATFQGQQLPYRQDVRARVQGKQVSYRQDALIQTDIYGIDSLAVSGREQVINNVCRQSSGTTMTVNNNNTPLMLAHGLSPDNKFKMTSKRQTPAKRKSLTNPSSPIRKKMKSTTGIQTAVCLTKQKTVATVNSTQTTGDFILETAMKRANIRIEKKTVASQVTPQKRSPKKLTEGHEIMTNRHIKSNVKFVTSKLLARPLLIDSFSQVNEDNIWAETSHNLAESQTMTDEPLSISTQTHHSYLGNLPERSLAKKQFAMPPEHPTVQPNSCSRNKPTFPASMGFQSSFACELQTKVIQNSVKGGLHIKANCENIGEIHTESFPMPDKVQNLISESDSNKAQGLISRSDNSDKVQGLVSGSDNNDKVQGLVSENNNCNNETSFPTSAVTLVLLASDVKCTSTTDAMKTCVLTEPCTSNIIHEAQERKLDSVCGDTDNESVDKYGSVLYSHTPCETNDTEVQAMSASDFDQLLQSSGIFIDNLTFLSDSSLVNQSHSVTGQQKLTFQQAVSDFDFFDNTNSIGTNTQSMADFSLFDNNTNSIGTNTQSMADFSLFDNNTNSIGTNTQSMADFSLFDNRCDVDFLDLMMTNMETQTLNESDLFSMGLIDNIPVHRMGVSTSDLNVTDCDRGRDNAIFVTGERMQTLSATSNNDPQKLFINIDFLGNKMMLDQSCNTSESCCDGTLSKTKLPRNTDQSDTVQMETQTTRSDILELPSYTEMQTQVESSDTDFVTINMETQTSFEDLQQFCEWLK